MPARIIVGLIAGALLLGLCFFEEGDEGTALTAKQLQGPEALTWLRRSHNESALASNRFLETHNAVRFVERLYGAGAERVIVPLAAIENDGVEIYADSLVVTLPKDPEKRDRVWKLCKPELQREGLRPPKDAPDQVLLWWD